MAGLGGLSCAASPYSIQERRGRHHKAEFAPATCGLCSRYVDELSKRKCRGIRKMEFRRGIAAFIKHRSMTATSSMEHGADGCSPDQDSSWISALECNAGKAEYTGSNGMDYAPLQESKYNNSDGETIVPPPIPHWNQPKYKAPWSHGDERGPKVDQKTWRLKDPIFTNSYGYEAGYEQTSEQVSTTPPPESSAMSQIAEKLRGIKAGNKNVETRKEESRIGNLVKRLAHPPGALIVPHGGDPVFPELNKSWSTPDHLIVEPASTQKLVPKFPWEMDDSPEVFADEEPQPRVKPPSLAELILPDTELRRLRTLMIAIKDRLKIGRLGVTNGVVQGIHERWSSCEIVKVKCEPPASLNMRRIHEDLERRTGGLVIWRAGSSAVVYRGKDYSGPPAKQKVARDTSEEQRVKIPEKSENPASDNVQDWKNMELQRSVHHVPFLESEYERQMDRLLAALGPRYADWTGNKPVPVDGDVLPAIDHTFKTPFRLLPYGVNPKLSDIEMTNLRRVARPLPPHFVVSRNKGLQGLANAIVKLWEKSEIAKVAIKRNAQNTNNERMADELKRHTGGVLLGRDKEFIIFYRGKDFLPAAVAAAFEEREAMSRLNEEKEDRARMLPTGKAHTVVHTQQVETGPEAEADAKLKEWVDSEEERKRRALAIKSVKATRARRIERRLAVALAKKKKAEEVLQKLESFIKPREPPPDRETITEEERYMLRKLGLRMTASLLLGIRGVYSGIIENMHLHWKYREMVKVIYKGRNRVDIEDTARTLELESGGILVGIVPTSKGQAILVYRGKNYTRPPELRPKNLLTKKKALERYTVNQRRESLARYIFSLEENINSLGYMLERAKADEDGCEQTESDVHKGVNHSKMDENDNRDMVAESPPPVKQDRMSKHDELGPILRARPLTNRERLVLRKKALQNGKPSHFHVGKSNVLGGLIRSIRLFLKRGALVKIGTKGRATGTSLQEIVELIEDGTGAAFVCQEKHKLIFYRGWPEGREHPAYMEEDLSAELLSAVKEEDDELDFSFGSRAGVYSYGGDEQQTEDTQALYSDNDQTDVDFSDEDEEELEDTEDLYSEADDDDDDDIWR